MVLDLVVDLQAVDFEVVLGILMEQVIIVSLMGKMTNFWSLGYWKWIVVLGFGSRRWIVVLGFELLGFRSGFGLQMSRGWGENEFNFGESSNLNLSMMMQESDPVVTVAKSRTERMTTAL